MSVEDYYASNQDDLNNEFVKIFKMCLGNAAQMAFSNHDFKINLVNGILKVIKERNTIIHYYFRTVDFYTNWNNEKHYKMQLDWLKKRVKKTRNVCDELRKLLGATLWEDRWYKSLGDHKPLKER